MSDVLVFKFSNLATHYTVVHSHQPLLPEWIITFSSSKLFYATQGPCSLDPLPVLLVEQFSHSPAVELTVSGNASMSPTLFLLPACSPSISFDLAYASLKTFKLVLTSTVPSVWRCGFAGHLPPPILDHTCLQ